MIARTFPVSVLTVNVNYPIQVRNQSTMAPIVAKSPRNAMNIRTSSRIVLQSVSAPLNLETVNSEESSVFSGLEASPNSARHEDSENQYCSKDSVSKKKVEYSHKAKIESLRAVSWKDDNYPNTHLSTARSGSTAASTQTHNRSKGSNDNSNDRARQNNDGEHTGFLYGEDVSPMSYESVSHFSKSKESLTLLAEIDYTGDDSQDGYQQNQQNQEYNQSSQQSISPSRVQEERIAAMLNDFEKEMDKNLELLQEEEKQNDYHLELLDVIPQPNKSNDKKDILSHQQARKLQSILHQARTEVEILRDNNEQFASEIEQLEEEHSSERKLMEERTKQKISEMKLVHQEEIDYLVREKDAAIVEAGRQGLRYAASAKKQIASLKREIETLKAHGNGAIEEERRKEEMTSRQRALSKSYEHKLQKIRLELDNEKKDAVNEAVSSLAQRMLADRNKEINQRLESLRKRLLDEKNEATHQLEGKLVDARNTIKNSKFELRKLHEERSAVTKALESVKDNLFKRYSKQMQQLRKSRGSSDALQMVRDEDHAENAIEGLFKEVIEAFTFLLDSSERTQVEDIKREKNEVHAKARKELITRHRAELERMRKQTQDSKDKICQLEESLENMGLEKRVLQDKLRRATEKHRTEVQKLEAERTAIFEVEKRRKELAIAMATGQLELAYTMAGNRDLFLKSGRTTESLQEQNSGNQLRSHHEPVSDSTKGLRLGKDVDETRGTEKSPQVRESEDDQIEHELSDEVESFQEQVNCSEDAETNALARFLKGNNSAGPALSHPMTQDSSSPEIQTPITSEVPQDQMKFDSKKSLETKKSYDSSDLSFSSRSWTIMEKVREQSKESNEKPKREPSGAKEITNTNPSASLKKKSLAILRSFKSSKSSEENSEKQRDPVTCTQGKEPEGKSKRESLSTRARRIRNRRDSQDRESLSSLKTNTGAASPRIPSEDFSSYRPSDDKNSEPETEEAEEIANEAKSQLEGTYKKEKHEVSELSLRQKRLSSRGTLKGKRQTPLRMFAQKNTKSNASDGASLGEASESGHKVTEKSKDEDEAKDVQQSPLRNTRKPTPLQGFQLGSDEKSRMQGLVVNGKKPVPEWVSNSIAQFEDDFTKKMPLQSEAQGLEGKTSIPGTIAVKGSAKKEHLNPATAGHTMCLQPLAVVNSKGQNFDNLSRMSTESHDCGTNDGDGSITDDTQSQMRKYPPLGDHESDEDSSDDDTDNYESGNPLARFASESTHDHIVDSRTMDESTSIYMDSSNDSRPIIGQGQFVHRGASETSSEATTAITTHTFRSPLQTEPKRSLPRSPRNIIRPPSVRRAANFVESRARRSSLRRGEV